jgi:hypothetical protein
LSNTIALQEGLDNMQDNMIFVLASYVLAGVVLAGFFCAVLWQWHQTRTRLIQLEILTKTNKQAAKK